MLTTRSHTIGVYTAFVFLVGWLLIGSLQSPPSSEIRYDQTAAEAAKKNQKRDQRESFWQQTLNDPTAFFTLWVAAFTAILSFSTIGLWCVTRAAANAALRQANAMVAIKFPTPRIVEMKLVEYRDENDRIGTGDRVPPGILPDLCRPLVMLQNLGRTEMYLQEFCCDWIISDTLPIAPTYQHIRPLNGTLPGSAVNSPQVWFLNFQDIIRPTPEQRIAIENRTHFLWVFGFFSYLNFMRDRSVIGFIARWDITQGFVREPNPRYEYGS